MSAAEPDKAKKATEEDGADDQKKSSVPLDQGDIDLLKRYGVGPYAEPIKKLEDENKDMLTKINKLCGIKESDTGLSHPSTWDLESDKKRGHGLFVARCTKIIKPTDKTVQGVGNKKEPRYMINVPKFAKYSTKLGQKMAPTDVDEGMRVGVHPNKFLIEIGLPQKIDPSVTAMTVEEKPDVTYADIGGCKE
jgi:26S proteasome regulatory subunit T1